MGGVARPDAAGQSIDRVGHDFWTHKDPPPLELDQRRVETLDAGSIEEATRRVPELAECRHAEARGAECRPVRRIVVDLEVAARWLIWRVGDSSVKIAPSVIASSERRNRTACVRPFRKY
jgi:hypothetical protein